ncbi:alpha-glucan phosphorylase [Paralysiella testudinis]|uniref:Alpha-glucan phosphorylase n=1 Tax=Paralysiella testudinis TaxID=2809020 RepID=A0A892ZIN2_9NEIS|nr:alpha-glucan phosphorylase [Paralysiella testudinis]QRQ82340.1 alpha-glucan phosphorylase [Paralysiella testudinis]
MNHNIPTVKTVHVLLPNLDERQFAIFRMAFKMHNTTNYQLIREGDGIAPELVLVDGDAGDGQEQWRSAKQKFANARVVYFATKPPSFTAPYLAKPIKFDSLFANLRNLLQGNGMWVAGMAEPAATANPVRHTAAGNEDKHRNDVPDAGHEHQRQESVSIRSFSTDATLLGLVRRLAAENTDTAIMVDGKPVLVIFPAMEKILLAADPERIEELCLQPALTLETKAVPANSGLHEKAKIKTMAFIWQLAIWTAQGRLIEPVTPDSVLKLKSWPNMTRMAFLPDAMRLSAFLIKTPVSLSMLYKLLSVDMKDILNFIAATYATGYLQVEQPAFEPKKQQREIETVLSRAAPKVETATATPAASDDEPAKQPRGVLQRLMSRLRGK